MYICVSIYLPIYIYIYIKINLCIYLRTSPEVPFPSSSGADHIKRGSPRSMSTLDEHWTGGRCLHTTHFFFRTLVYLVMYDSG